MAPIVALPTWCKQHLAPAPATHGTCVALPLLLPAACYPMHLCYSWHPPCWCCCGFCCTCCYSHCCFAAAATPGATPTTALLSIGLLALPPLPIALLLLLLLLLLIAQYSPTSVLEAIWQVASVALIVLCSAVAASSCYTRRFGKGLIENQNYAFVVLK